MKLPRNFQAFVIVVVVAAGGLVWYLPPKTGWTDWPELLLFALLIGLATMFPIPAPHGGYIVATPVLFYVLFAVHPPGASILVASIAYATGAAVSLGWFPWRVVFNGAQIGISVAVASYVFRALGGNTGDLSLRGFVFPLVVAALSHQVTNNLLVSSFFSRLRRLPLLPTWFSDLRDLFLSNLLSVTSAILLAALYVSVHPLTLLLYLLSLPVQRWALQLYVEQRKIHGQAIDSLVVAIDVHFPQGRGHSRRVADIAAAIAGKLNLPESTVEGIELGALIHDVGLIGIEGESGFRDRVDGDDARRFREHTKIGAEIARDFPRKDVAEIVLYHHERFDGTGYPAGLRGSEIPLGARVVALAEVYDSMVSGGFPDSLSRSYKEVRDAIRAQSGGAFDPEVVRAFLRAVEEGLIEREPPRLITAEGLQPS